MFAREIIASRSGYCCWLVTFAHRQDPARDSESAEPYFTHNFTHMYIRKLREKHYHGAGMHSKITLCSVPLVAADYSSSRSGLLPATYLVQRPILGKTEQRKRIMIFVWSAVRMTRPAGSAVKQWRLTKTTMLVDRSFQVFHESLIMGTALNHAFDSVKDSYHGKEHNAGTKSRK